MKNPKLASIPAKTAHSGSNLYGKGNFTTIAVNENCPLLWEKHWRRLLKDAEKIGIDISEYTETATLDAVQSTIARSTSEIGRVRITFSDERASNIWQSDTELQNPTSLSIITGIRRVIPKGYLLTDSPFPVNSRSPLAGVKSCNYLEQILAKDEAIGRGFHEAVRTNERGHVTSGCMSNIFWLKGEKLYTPALSTGCLAGTTREFVLENIDCDEVEAEIGELNSADAIYLTSAGLGISRVDEFEGRKLPGRSDVLTKLKSASRL